MDYHKGQRYDKIKKQLLEQKSIFTDSLFPCTSSSLGSADSLVESDSVQWKRPRDLCDNPKLFADGSSLTQIKGGLLSSFWFLQVLQIVGGLKELLFKVVVNYSEQEWQDAFPDNYIGMFRFRFWRFGRWVEVVVDDLLPCVDGRLLFAQAEEPCQFWQSLLEKAYAKCKPSLDSRRWLEVVVDDFLPCVYGRLLFAQAEEPCQFWQSLLEKAYAKLLGSYGALSEGYIADALVDLTGGVSETVALKGNDLESNEDSRAHFYHLLATEMSEHSIVCSSIQASNAKDVEEVTNEGLARGRMYHVTSLKKIHLTDVKLRTIFKGREKVAVIRLRDTMGSRGTSCVNSPTHSTNSNTEADSDQAQSKLSEMSGNKQWMRLKQQDRQKFGLSIESEGEIWLPFEDFARFFHEVIIVRLYSNNFYTSGGRKWHDFLITSAWTVGGKGTAHDRSGGGNTGTETFFRNPQFILDISSSEEEIILQFLQWQGSEPSSASPKPLPSQILPIGLSIFLVESNRKYRLKRDWGFTPLILHLDHVRRREVQYKGTLNKGRYLLVPTAFKVGSTGQFLLRIISRANLKLREITQDIPTELCGLSCIASPTLWVTIIVVRSAVGLPVTKSVFCSVKCENSKGRTAICDGGKDVTWSDALVFYRRKPERPVIIKVYAHKVLSANQFLGIVELQASVNHGPTTMEFTLSDKKGNVLDGRLLTVEMVTEDDLMSV